MGLTVGLEVSGTLMPRGEGQPPLLAMSSMLDGKIVQAAVIDPAVQPDTHVRDLHASVQPSDGAVQSAEQPRP